jgi:hypothetical protein
MIVKDSVAVKNGRVLTLQGAHDFLSRPYCAAECFHLLIPLVLLPCGVFDMLGYWFLVSVELALVG